MPHAYNLNTLIGNSAAVNKASRLIQSGRIPQTLLITGPCSLAIEEFALGFAGSLLTRQDTLGLHLSKLQSGNHPDLYVLRPEGKGNQYTIETIRQFNSLLVLPPTESLHKVFILLEAERMLPVTANALLKSIEEPARDAVILLVSKAPELLLPTVCSRCQTISLSALSDEEIALWLERTMGVDRPTAHAHARLAEGSQWRARALASGWAPYQDALLSLLQSMQRKQATYRHIQEVSEVIVEAIDSKVKQVGAQKSKQAEEAGEGEYWSPQQRAAQEKRDEGDHSSLLREAFNLLCIHILGFFRDIEATEVGLSGNKLYYPHAFAGGGLGTSSSLQQATGPSLQHMEQQVQLANALLDRFTPLKTCVEALFLDRM